MARWSACAAAAALAACTDPAQNNAAAEANAVTEANAASAVEAAGNAAAGNAAGNDSASANSAAPDKGAAEPSAAQESYYALGQEPGWALKIASGRLDYSGNYGDKKINVARPEPKPSPNGRRYATERLTVDITYARCNDAMSGFGFEHQVTVTADGETFKGCGGARKKEWDM
jgi:uncharacterized membrane protein